MSNNQLQQKLRELPVSNKNPNITTLLNDVSIDAILQAVIESLPFNCFTHSNLPYRKQACIDCSEYGIYRDDVKTILTEAMSTGGKDE